MNWGGISHGLDGKTLLTKTTNLAYKVGESCDTDSGYTELLSVLNESIANIIACYANGKYDKLTEELTFEEYCKLSVDLFNTRKIDRCSATYEEIRKIMTYSLQGVYRST